MVKKKVARILELRASSELKGLEEQRAELKEKMEGLVTKIEEEKRAFSKEEDALFSGYKNELDILTNSITAIEEKRATEKKTVVDPSKNTAANEEQVKAEERAFINYIRGVVEERADVNLTLASNGAVVPASIANKIIKKVQEISPIYQLATRYNVGGTLSIPYYDEDTTSIQMTYATEFSELESSSGKFLSIELKGFLAGALTKISNSLINNSQFDIVSFTINAMAEAISKWIDKELLNGTTDKIDGLKGVKQIVTAAATTVVTSDELIDLQETIPDDYQENAIWIMNKDTRKSIRKLKDGNGQYILNKDATAKWGYTLFGKDVFTSANMAKMAAGKTAIYYGDMSGLAVKLSEDVNIQILREKFATQHATGVIAWCEIDSKVENAQKIAKLNMATA